MSKMVLWNLLVPCFFIFSNLFNFYHLGHRWYRVMLILFVADALVSTWYNAGAHVYQANFLYLDILF